MTMLKMSKEFTEQWGVITWFVAAAVWAWVLVIGIAVYINDLFM